MSVLVMTTYSGRRVDPTNVTWNDVVIEDIAHALGMLCRFGGHTSRFYSVAQHSVRVAKYLPPHLRMRGLMHDATEYLLQDLVRPLKRSERLDGYVELEAKLEALIEKKFELEDDPDRLVKVADNAVLKAEIRQFGACPEIELSDEWWREFEEPPSVQNGWSPYEAEQNFLRAFYWIDAHRRGFADSDHLEELK